MAKRKAAKSNTKRTGKKSEEASGRARVEVRLEREVFEKLRKLTDEAEVSLNQLFAGLAEFAVTYGHAGDLTYENAMRVPSRQAGVVTFGVPGDAYTAADVDELEEYAKQLPSAEQEKYLKNFPTPKVGDAKNTGMKFFSLDFTPRRALVSGTVESKIMAKLKAQRDAE